MSHNKNRKSHAINEEAVERRHRCYILFPVEVTGIRLPEIVDLLHIGHLARDNLFGDCGFLVVEFILRVCAGVNVNHMEAVVVVASHHRVAVVGAGKGKLIEDGLVFKHLAKLALHALLHHNALKGLLGVANVPYFDCEVITSGYVLSVFEEFSTGVG